MFGESTDNAQIDVAISADDLYEYAGEWTDAEQTKLWAEEQLKALVPPGSQLQVGSFVIRRDFDTIEVLKGA